MTKRFLPCPCPQLQPTNDLALTNYASCLMTACYWDSRDHFIKELHTISRRQVAMGTLPPVNPHYAFCVPLIQNSYEILPPMRYVLGGRRLVIEWSLQTRRLRRYAREASRLAHLPAFDHPSIIERGDRRLRVGYVSSDFEASHLMQSVFGMHDKVRYEVFCYALSDNDGSDHRRKIEDEVEHFTNIRRLDNASCARHIHADAIDVLFDLNGYTRGARTPIFAMRPAPIQVSYVHVAAGAIDRTLPCRRWCMFLLFPAADTWVSLRRAVEFISICHRQDCVASRI